MKANDLFVRQRVDLHHGQGLVHSLLAGGALLPVPWTSERSRTAARQAAVVEFLPDEIADGFRVHLGGAPFVVPKLETSDVELKAPPAKSQRDSFHQQLLLREDRVAGVARLAVAWTAPNPSDAGMRQAPVLDLASDQKAERFRFHSGLVQWTANTRQIHRSLDASGVNQ